MKETEKKLLELNAPIGNLKKKRSRKNRGGFDP